MSKRPKKDLAVLPPIAPETQATGELVGANTGPLTLQELGVALTPIEENFARLFVLYNNATAAYIEASGSKAKRSVARVMAWEMGHRPHVRKRVQEYYSAAAALAVIDCAAILENDRQIVEGFKHADEITQHIHECCRYCHGVDHRYQWANFEEYIDALKRVDLENDKRRELGQRELAQPSDGGGYGFDPQAEPNLFCPRCEGRGIAVNVIADTTKLQGPARAIVKGIKVTANGTEVVFHDVDKAKERLLRAGGVLGDDAANVARGAAAGAAAGATAAIAAAKAADSMTLDEAQRLYQQLA